MNAPVDIPLAELAKRPEPNANALEQRAQSMIEFVRGMTIGSQADYDLLHDTLRDAKDRAKKLDQERRSWTDPIRGWLDRFNAKFQPAIKLYETCEAEAKAKMSAWLVEQERIAAEERRKAEAAAAAERQRLEAEAAERRRVAEEEAAAARRAEEERAAAARAEAARLEAQATEARTKKAREEAAARAAELRRQNEEAEQRAAAQAAEARAAAEVQARALEQEAAVTMAAPAVVPAVHKGSGIAAVKSFDFEVTDMLALAKFIVEKRPDLVVLLQVDAVKMRAQVKLHGAATAIDGVRVFPKLGIAVR